MAKKRLVVLIERTTAMRPYWNQILSDYLKKLIRGFVGDKEAKPKVQMVLVWFFDLGPFRSPSPMVQAHSWVSNVDRFFEKLEAFNLGTYSSYSELAISKGLKEVLMLCHKKGQSDDFQNHCILVSNGDPVVKRSISDNLYDGVPLPAKSFPGAFVSLSVICPRQHPVMRSVYNVAKGDPSTADLTIKIAESPGFIVLIADEFVKASADKNHLGLTSLSSVYADAASAYMMPTRTELLSSQSDYTQVWEGALFVVEEGEKMHISDLQAFGKLSFPKTLAEGWLTEMLIYQFIPKESMDEEKYNGKEKYSLAVLAAGAQPFIKRMQNENVYALIVLPSHVLVLEVSDSSKTWAGKLYSKDILPGTQSQQNLIDDYFLPKEQPKPSQSQQMEDYVFL